MACALAPSWPVLLIFRLLSGIFASAPIAVVTGILADIYQDSTTRGRSIAVYMTVRIAHNLASHKGRTLTQRFRLLRSDH